MVVSIVTVWICVRVNWCNSAWPCQLVQYRSGGRHVVAQLVEVLRYEPEGRRFDSPLRSLEGKGGWCVGLITLPHLCVDCVEILRASAVWSPKGLSRLVMGLLYRYDVHYSYAQNAITAGCCLLEETGTHVMLIPVSEWSILKSLFESIKSWTDYLLLNQFCWVKINWSLYRLLRPLG